MALWRGCLWDSNQSIEDMGLAQCWWPINCSGIRLCLSNTCLMKNRWWSWWWLRRTLTLLSCCFSCWRSSENDSSHSHQYYSREPHSPNQVNQIWGRSSDQCTVDEVILCKWPSWFWQCAPVLCVIVSCRVWLCALMSPAEQQTVVLLPRSPSASKTYFPIPVEHLEEEFRLRSADDGKLFREEYNVCLITSALLPSSPFFGYQSIHILTFHSIVYQHCYIHDIPLLLCS